jgi:folate-binding protein YgfZ
MAGGLATLLHKHLDKYRPFYKCTLTVETGTLTGIGTANPGDPALPAPGHINQVEDGWVCRIPGSVPRVVALESTSGQSVWLETRKQQFAQSGPTRWQEDDLLSGIFPLSIDDTERYTPQEIHLDRCDFISFSKGCYTGQEIVARMHYKSKPKRQLYLLTLNIPADQPSASEIEVLDQSGETLGKSIKAVPATDNRLLVLVPLPIQDTAGSEALQTAQDPQPEVRIF